MKLKLSRHYRRLQRMLEPTPRDADAHKEKHRHQVPICSVIYLRAHISVVFGRVTDPWLVVALQVSLLCRHPHFRITSQACLIPGRKRRPVEREPFVIRCSRGRGGRCRNLSEGTETARIWPCPVRLLADQSSPN